MCVFPLFRLQQFALTKCCFIFANFSERQKKTIQDNLDLFKLGKQVQQLEGEIQKLSAEIGIMGENEAREKYNAALSNVRGYESKIQRLNGRMQGLTDMKTTLKRKLKEP